MEKLEQYREETKNLTVAELLQWGLKTFGRDNLILASSFSIEDQLLTVEFNKCDKAARIFTLDTGRHFNETYDVWQYTQAKYGVKYEIGFPEPEEITAVVAEKGVNFFQMSVEDRKECCRIRKMEPLTKALNTCSCWITGLRAEQSVTRTELHTVEWDAQWGIYKINPLAAWSEEEVWEQIEEQKIPFNKLQKEGFLSIGCACCTRAVKEGEDIRAGRWWWEDPKHKECGLHKKK